MKHKVVKKYFIAAVFLCGVACADAQDKIPKSPEKKIESGKASLGQLWSSPPRTPQVWDSQPAATAGRETVRTRVVDFSHAYCKGGAEVERFTYCQRYTPSVQDRKSLPVQNMNQNRRMFN